MESVNRCKALNEHLPVDKTIKKIIAKSIDRLKVKMVQWNHAIERRLFK